MDASDWARIQNKIDSPMTSDRDREIYRALIDLRVGLLNAGGFYAATHEEGTPVGEGEGQPDKEGAAEVGGTAAAKTPEGPRAETTRPTVTSPEHWPDMENTDVKVEGPPSDVAPLDLAGDQG